MSFLSDSVTKNKLFTRRAFLVSGGKLGLMSLLLGKLYNISITKSDEYKVLSENNHINLSMVSPARGSIRDRSGKMLAMNQPNFKVMFDKKETKNYLQSLEKLFSHLKNAKYNIEEIIDKIKKASARFPICIIDDLSWENVLAIEEYASEMPGIFIEMGNVRYYAYSKLLSQIIGYTAIANDSDKQEYSLNNVGEFSLGKRGIEKFYNRKLIGEFGVKKMEVNAKGLYIREISSLKSSPGDDFKLSIDVNLQSFIMSKLDKKGSAAIVTDIKTGEVLSLASAPTFDSSKFVRGVSTEYWNSLLKNEYRPLVNKTINGVYPPGSIFKLVVFLAALADGIKEDLVVDCKGYMMVGNRKFRCASIRGHGKIKMRRAIEKSCNCYIYTIAQMIGSEKIIEMSKYCGFGRKTGLDLPGESNGFVPTKEWKRKRLGQEWMLGDTMNLAIGQGYLLATPMQLANFTSMIANGGMLHIPALAECSKSNPIILEKIQKDLDVIQDGMFRVVNRAGTAFRAKSGIKGFDIAAKTGTSQVIAKRFDYHNLSDLKVPWRRRNHSLCIAFAPYHDPKYACSILVEHGGDGSKVAAPLAREILLKTKEIFG